MSKPINRKKQRKTYFLFGLGSYILILFLGCHLGHYIYTHPGEYLSPDTLTGALNHFTENPFLFLPTDIETFATFALLGLLVPMLIYSEYLRRRDLRPMVESGSAKWNEDLKKFYRTYTDVSEWPRIFEKAKWLQPVRTALTSFHKVASKLPLLGKLVHNLTKKLADFFLHPQTQAGNRNMILSKDICLSMDGRKTRRNCNTVIIGGSGTGKSRFEVKPNAMQANCSYVFTDPSGELLESLGCFFVDEGYDVRVFNLVEMEHSSCYNPFHYIRDQKGVYSMINALIKNTTPKGSSTNDPFWEKAETALLQAICFYLVSECNKEDQNFSNVMKLLRCAKAAEGQEDVDSTLDILFNDLKEKDPEHIAVQSYAVFKSAGGGKTAQSILISCQTRLQTFNLDDIKTLTSIDNIDLGSVGDKKVALFCITPSADTSFNYLIALMYTQLFETLYFHAETECKGKRLTHHVRFLLDEFANVGQVPDFPQKLSTMRKYEISCTIVIQALSQLKALYKDDWDVLMGNCDSTIFLGASDQTTLDYVSKILGKETIRSINSSRSYGRQGSHSLSYNKTGRELMTPDELRVMDNNDCIVLIRGEFPFYTKKYQLEKHPNYKRTGDYSDKFKFDVKEKFHTGQNMSDLNIRENLPLRVFKEAQIADTREAEHLHRHHSRPVQTHSAGGREMLRIHPLREDMPGIEIPPEQRTPVQERILAEAQSEYSFDGLNVLPEEEMDHYHDIFETLYGGPVAEEEELAHEN